MKSHDTAELTSKVVAAIVQSVLAIARDDDGKDLSGGELVRAVKMTAKQFLPLLDKYCSKTLSAQNDCLEAIEDFCVDDESTELVCAKVVHVLYDTDIVSEQAVLKWYKSGKTDAVEARSKGFGARFRVKMEKFIEWLEEDEDDSDDSD